MFYCRYDYIEKLQKYTVNLADGEDLQRSVSVLQTADDTVVAIATAPVRISLYFKFFCFCNLFLLYFLSYSFPLASILFIEFVLI